MHPIIRVFGTLSIILFAAALPGCVGNPSARQATDQDISFVPAITVTSPKEGTVVPNNLGNLTIAWNDDTGETGWTVFLRVGEKKVVAASKGKSISVDMGTLEEKGLSQDRHASVRVCRGSDPERVQGCGAPVVFVVSRLELHNLILYRLVEPLFNAGQDSVVMRKDLGGEGPRPVFEAKAVCIGCHDYSSQGYAAFNIRKGKDRRLVIVRSDDRGLRLVDTRKIGEFAFLSWSPDGRHLAIVANTFGTIDVKTDVVEPFNLMYQSGDIAIYDRETGQIKLLPGASEMDFTEDMPAWSPDGKYLLFVKYQADTQSGIKDMGIYRVPFNDGAGGVPEAILAPSQDGEFFYFPNYSPDGRWISFVQGNGSRGVFARRTSDIYVMPSGGGEPKKLSFNVDGMMDSWHRWSSDGRWLLFSSKRDGDMTALYLSNVDQEGKAYPPVMLAQNRDRKVNLPEFVRSGWTGQGLAIGFQEMIEKVLKDAQE